MKITNIIKEELQNILNEKTYKVYHGTNEKFGKFNFNKTTQGIIWFTDSIDSIQKGEHGGQGNKYIMTRYITINNPAGWDEYEKYGLGQLQDMGYDGVILPQDDKTDYFVFSNKNISAKPLTEEEDYRGQHTAPGIDDSPMYDVTNSFGKDMYTNNALRYFGGYGDYDRYSITLIQQAHNKPNMPVKIYRAVPSILTNQEKINNYEKHKAYILKTGKLPREIDNWQNSSEYYDWISDEIERLKLLPQEQDAKVKINSGDWVTINPAYAKQHGISNLNGKFKVLTKTVPAKNLYTNGDSIHEWGYVENAAISEEVQAWHGSQNDFDKFDTSKIGTGDGGDVYGWGIYFTNSQEIGTHYGKDGYTYLVTLHKGKTPDQYDWLQWEGLVTQEQREKITNQAQRENIELFLVNNDYFQSYVKKIQDEINKVSGEFAVMERDSLQQKINNKLYYITNELKGGYLYDTLTRLIFKSNKETSLFLLRAGIDGIKFNALAVNRDMKVDKTKDFNYVIFDPNAVTIEKKIPTKNTTEIKEEENWFPNQPTVSLVNEETNRFTNADTNINLNEGDIYFIIKKDLINSASWSEMFWLHMFNSQTNEKMGRMFVEFNHQNKQAKVWRSHVIEEFRGKGYGKRLYLKTKEFANEHGYNLYGDDVQSQDALNVWDSFKKSGLAKTDDDGKLYIEEIDNENITITPKDIKLVGNLKTDGYESIIEAYVYPNQSRTPIKYEFLSSINLDKYSYRVSGTFNQQPKSFNDKDLIKIEIVLDYENVENYVANRKNISTEIKNQFKKQLADKLNQSSQTIDERKKKRQMGMALPIGQIFSTGMGEGVADKYAEKEFNIPNTGKDDYYRATAALPPDPSMGEYIGVVMGDVNGRTEILSRIFKSPKNLSQFDSNTRAVTDKQGNLYVAEKDGNFYHDDLMDAIAKTGAQNSFMQWYRMRTSNIFALSGSYMELYRKQTRELEDEFYNNAKKANPQFKFLAQHHADVANENVDDNNSSKKLYYHGRSKSRPYTGKYIFITDNIGYASGYSDDNKLYAYSIPFDKNKIFTINNPNHLKLLKKYIDDQTINAIINDSGEGEEIDWATLSYISTDLFEEPEDLFQHLSFYGVRLKERQGIESIYVFNEKNLKPEGVVDLTTPEMIKQIGQFYKDFEKDKNLLEEGKGYMSTYMRGHPIYLKEPPSDWRYEDTDEKIHDVPERPCAKCGKLPTPEGHDACIANLPGVKFACCGHGKGDGYIAFEDNRVIRQENDPKRFEEIINDLKAERDKIS